MLKIKKKISKRIPLSRGAIKFLKLFKEKEIYKDIPPNLKGVVTQSIRLKGALNSKHLKLLNKAVKYAGITDILDKKNPRLQSNIEEPKKKVKSNITNNNVSDYPFDNYWKTPSGNSAKQNHELYIKSNIWKQKRKYLLSKRGCKCQNPNCVQPIVKKSKLHCHHLTYKRFGCEDENDLQILCETCHNEIHRNLTISEIQKNFETNKFKNGFVSGSN